MGGGAKELPLLERGHGGEEEEEEERSGEGQVEREGEWG